jgi:regulatory protein YycI of two-component signal transduction system YycFG|tara:strand:- start:295 stop:492 length:198 start_codon:yes stop_codon:yes gene_type:complete
MKNKKNILIVIFVILGMYLVLSFNDHNLKRAVDACLAGSQKLSESKITDLEEARKFCEDQIKKNK